MNWKSFTGWAKRNWVQVFTRLGCRCNSSCAGLDQGTPDLASWLSGQSSRRGKGKSKPRVQWYCQNACSASSPVFQETTGQIFASSGWISTLKSLTKWWRFGQVRKYSKYEWGFWLCRVRGGAAGPGTVERVVHIGQKPLGVGKTGITGCGCWAALPLGVRWVKTCYLLFWCQKRAVKAPSQASVTGPDGASRAAYDTN